MVNLLKGHDNVVRALVFIENGYLASGSYDKKIKIWDIKQDRLIRTLEGHTYWVTALAYQQNGYLSSGSEDMNIKILEIKE